jgi:PAS domain S-box-containing protein
MLQAAIGGTRRQVREACCPAVMEWPMSSKLTNSQYRILVEHAPVMVWRSGRDGKCDYVNQTWLDWTGRTLAEALGEGWSQGVHPDDLQRCVEIYLSHFERRLPFEREYRLRRHDGVYRYIFDRGVPFMDERGQFGGFIGSCVDVHERRTADTTKATFVSMIAHDLRTPLQAASNYINLIREWLTRDEHVPPHTFDRLSVQLARITKLVRELSEISHWEAFGSLPLADESVCDLREIVGDALDIHSHALKAGGDKKHALKLEHMDRPMFVRGDRQRLVQVVDNIVENAIKYSPHGGCVDVVLKYEAGEHQIVIRDQGIGIPPEELVDVTRRYFRASNASPSHFPGLGLGLALARELVEAHGGRFAIESELGGGTVVRLYFPEVHESTP